MCALEKSVRGQQMANSMHDGNMIPEVIFYGLYSRGSFQPYMDRVFVCRGVTGRLCDCRTADTVVGNEQVRLLFFSLRLKHIS